MLTKPNNSSKSKKRLRDERKRLLLKLSVLDLQRRLRRLRRKKKRENLKNRNNLKNRRELKKSKLKQKQKHKL